MSRVLSAEINKIKTYRVFWVILGLFVFLLPIIFYGLGNINIHSSGPQGQTDIIDPSKIFHFPKVWQYLTYMASYFVLILGILMIILVTNEFSFGTLRQNIVDGLNRKEVIAGKVWIALLISIFCVLYVLILGFAFGITYSDAGESSLADGKIWYLVAFMNQLTGYLSLAILIGIFIKRSGFAIVLFILYTLVIERVFWIMRYDFVNYLPVNTYQSLTPFPVNILQNPHAKPDKVFELDFFIGLAYTAAFIILSYWLLKRKDIEK